MIEAKIDWDLQPVREVIPGFHGRFAHSSRMTFVLWQIDAGAVLPEHEHPHEQVAQVLDGQFEITIDGVTQVLGAGQMGVVLPNQRHSGRAITACRILDVFAPVREDYLPGSTGTVLGSALAR